ncbi:helix-turn-helix domain-containing protein [Streptomyces anulatus]|uniref:helix-turn-helix domain-containing protein n=1 Tax=Streptomyces anulatus TaxID=1892 RepID=UPI003416C01B
MTDTLLLTIPRAAKEIGVHRGTLYRYISDGEIEAIDIARPGSRQTRLRIPIEAVRNYISSRPRVVELGRVDSGR